MRPDGRDGKAPRGDAGAGLGVGVRGHGSGNGCGDALQLGDGLGSTCGDGGLAGGYGSAVPLPLQLLSPSLDGDGVLDLLNSFSSLSCEAHLQQQSFQYCRVDVQRWHWLRPSPRGLRLGHHLLRLGLSLLPAFPPPSQPSSQHFLPLAGERGDRGWQPPCHLPRRSPEVANGPVEEAQCLFSAMPHSPPPNTGGCKIRRRERHRTHEQLSNSCAMHPSAEAEILRDFNLRGDSSKFGAKVIERERDTFKSYPHSAQFRQHLHPKI